MMEYNVKDLVLALVGSVAGIDNAVILHQLVDMWLCPLFPMYSAVNNCHFSKYVRMSDFSTLISI